MACILFPTSSTPDAPNAFNPATSTLSFSFTSTRNLVIHASKCLIFSSPPIAFNTLNGSSLADEFVNCACLSSRPGVLYLNFKIKNRKTK